MNAFSAKLDDRMLKGGLPPFLLSAENDKEFRMEWVDSFWAKDIQELYRLENKNSFQKFLELVFLQSGGIFDATSFAGPVGASRPTIKNYLNVLENTNVVAILKPFYSNKNKEIISAAKVYGFDTGFVSYFKGWDSLRDENRGQLWEHLVLNELIAHGHKPQYWRNKQKNEIDFILNKNRAIIAIECKWKAEGFFPGALKIFRSTYKGGKNVVVSANTKKSYKKKFNDLEVHFLSLTDLITEING